MSLDGEPGFGAFHRGDKPGTIRQEVFNIVCKNGPTVRIRIGEVIITVTLNDP